MTDAQFHALRWLVDQGGEGILNSYGRVVAGGEKSRHEAATWLRLVLSHHCGVVGTGRLGVTDKGRLAVVGKGGV